MLSDVLARPSVVADFTLAEWSDLVRCAREAQLLARLYVLFNSNGLCEHIPTAPRGHLLSAFRQAEKQASQVRWELLRIERDLNQFNSRVIVLKGGAYIYAGLAAGQGRILSDIDLLVKKDSLSVAEKLLRRFGWFAEVMDDHDERYYREWAHEIPPLKHVNRGAVLDLHHNIFPIQRMHVAVENLFNRAWKPNKGRMIEVLSPIDMLLHSATHLFYEGEFEVGLRDLTDMAYLMSGFSIKDWQELPERAALLGLEQPLFFAIRYTSLILKVEIPQLVRDRVDVTGPGWLQIKIYDWLFQQLFIAHHPIEMGRFFYFARFIMYLRGHILKLPLRLLIPHLARKSIFAVGEVIGIGRQPNQNSSR